MVRRLGVMVIVAALLVGGTALAAVEKGNKELSLSTSFNRTDVDVEGFDAMSYWIIQGQFGYFVTDSFELSIAPALTIDDDSNKTGTLGVRADFHFSTDSTTVPFVGVQATQSYFSAESGDEDVEENEFGYGVQGGAKFFVSESAFVLFELSWVRFTIEDVDVDNQRAFLGVGTQF